MLSEYFHDMKAEGEKSMIDIMKNHNMCFSVQCVRDIHSLLSIPLSDMQILCVCITLCAQHLYIIGMKPPKRRYVEESYGAVVAATFPSLLPYNAWTTAYYSGLTNNLLSFKLVPTNPDGAPTFLGVALFITCTNIETRIWRETKQL